MNSRMQRYQEPKKEVPKTSRTNKNDELYQTFYRENSFVEYDNGSLETNLEMLAVDLSKKKNLQTREDYHRVKEYDFIAPAPIPKAKQELNDFNTNYSNENKIYDINSILDVAKKNRNQQDENEQKRKLRNEDYNVLNNKTLGEIEKYREEKRKRLLKQQSIDESELNELIDTITKKTFLDDSHTKDLMSDLMSTSHTDALSGIPTETIKEEIHKEMDNSFYTRSMDLSDKDFNMDTSFDEDMQPSKVSAVVKVFLFIILLGVFGGIIYFLLNFI